MKEETNKIIEDLLLEKVEHLNDVFNVEIQEVHMKAYFDRIENKTKYTVVTYYKKK